MQVLLQVPGEVHELGDMSEFSSQEGLNCATAACASTRVTCDEQFDVSINAAHALLMFTVPPYASDAANAWLLPPACSACQNIMLMCHLLTSSTVMAVKLSAPASIGVMLHCWQYCKLAAFFMRRVVHSPMHSGARGFLLGDQNSKAAHAQADTFLASVQRPETSAPSLQDSPGLDDFAHMGLITDLLE